MIRLLYIDLFCGAGGTSTGVERATLKGRKCAKVIACVNHDANAIASHEANHPDALHFTEDIRTLNLEPLVAHLVAQSKKHPKAKVVLWASLECTNFSKAKGGMPRDADSRTLAEHLFRYVEAIKPDYIQIENVEDFMCWGDLDENGHPISRHKGTSYLKWVKSVCAYGYDYDWRLLNAADFGAYTSRKRLFGQFARTGLPFAFPEQTYAKNGDEGGMFNMYKKWKPVREVLDLADEGKSIFDRKKPLCEATLNRIYAGLIKFVAGGKEAFLVKYNSMNGKTGKYVAPGIDEPCPTVATRGAIRLVTPFVIDNANGGTLVGSSNPLNTITVKDNHMMACPVLADGRLVDVFIRMLKPEELAAAHSFPADYKLTGNRGDQVKQIGNSVPVMTAAAMCECDLRKVA